MNNPKIDNDTAGQSPLSSFGTTGQSPLSSERTTTLLRHIVLVIEKDIDQFHYKNLIGLINGTLEKDYIDFLEEHYEPEEEVEDIDSLDFDVFQGDGFS